MVAIILETEILSEHSFRTFFQNIFSEDLEDVHMGQEVTTATHVFQLEFIEQKPLNGLVHALIVQILDLLRDLAHLLFSLNRLFHKIRITISQHLSTGKAFDRNQHDL